MQGSTNLSFAKGHGTKNDFVLVADPDGSLDLDEATVVAICDRRSGIGADGVIRLVRESGVLDAPQPVSSTRWFMDYRNSDGSIAQMCGNGVRVFVAELIRLGLAEVHVGSTIEVGTRSGPKLVTRVAANEFDVDMGTWAYSSATGQREHVDVQVSFAGSNESMLGLGIDMGNPHVVVAVRSRDELAAIDLSTAPVITPTPPDGANIEIVLVEDLGGLGDGRGAITMRVFERGVGETSSCGTGACAAAVAVSVWADRERVPTRWLVRVPGGELAVEIGQDGHTTLAGPAEIVATGTWFGPRASG